MRPWVLVLFVLLAACGEAVFLPTTPIPTPGPTTIPPPALSNCRSSEARVGSCTVRPADGSITCPMPLIELFVSLGPPGMQPTPPPPPTPSLTWGFRTITLDGTDITKQVVMISQPSNPPAGWGWTHRPTKPLARGRHEVVVVYREPANTTESFRWTFEVQPIACAQ